MNTCIAVSTLFAFRLFIGDFYSVSVTRSLHLRLVDWCTACENSITLFDLLVERSTYYPADESLLAFKGIPQSVRDS